MAKKRKRAPGEGSIYFIEPKGLWAAARTVGYTPAGNPKRITGYGRTQIAARQALEKKITELGGLLILGGLEDGAGRVTVGQWLDSWLAYKANVAGRRPSTVERYQQVVDCHLKPAFGKTRLSKLRPAAVEELLVSMAADGLSPRSVRYAWSTLHNALRQAVKRGLVPANICERVEPPSQAATRPAALEAEAVRELLAAARRRSRQWALYHLALTTGMRRGELLALEWSDVDGGVVRVTKSQDIKGQVSDVKTESSRREVVLSDGDVAVLREHRDELDQHIKKAEDHGLWKGSERVFPSNVGTPLGARNLYRDFQLVLAEAGLPRVAFHALRHTAATLLLRAGVPVHVVSRRLGHRDAAITMRIYAHVLSDQAQAGAVELAELLAEFPGAVSAEAAPAAEEPVN